MEETQKQKPKRGKLLIIFAGILLLGLISAITYYALFSVSFTVKPSITIGGELSQDLGEIFDLEVIEGEEITITNNAPSDRIVKISDDSPEEIKVTYVSNLFLTNKDLNDWTWLGEGKEITYVVYGEEFYVNGVPEGFVAVYYPNKISYDYYDGVIVLSEDVGSQNLPFADDLNGGDESNYCLSGHNPDAKQCKGAKLWLVPSNAVNDNVIDWSRASEFYFETALIQFNTDGEFILSSGSELIIKPIYEVKQHASGDYTITTTIA